MLVAVAAGTGAFGGVGAVGYATSELNKNCQPSCDVDPNSDPDTDKDATREVEKKITFNRAYLPYPDVYLDSNHRINRTLDAGRAVTSAPTTGAQPTQQCKSKRKQERTTTTIAWGASAPGWGADVGAFFESSNAVAAQKMNEFEAAWGSYFVPLEQKLKDSLPKNLTIASSKRTKDDDSSSKLRLCTSLFTSRILLLLVDFHDFALLADPSFVVGNVDCACHVLEKPCASVLSRPVGIAPAVSEVCHSSLHTFSCLLPLPPPCHHIHLSEMLAHFTRLEVSTKGESDAKNGTS